MTRACITAILLAGLAAVVVVHASAPAESRQYRKHYYSGKKWTRARRPAANPVRDAAAEAAKRPRKLLTRAEILATDPERLERLGRRLIVGYESLADMRTLVEKRAVAGVFLTDHNVRGRRAADVARDMRSLQDIRRAQGLPQLIVAADQEGGYVSRLSPPLKWQPSLGMLVSNLKTDDEREKAVRDYAETQARELERLGVTMNFGPVVDLRIDMPNRNDRETQIFWRAIDNDPFIVADVAGWYCDTLTKFNIICTLKHFPGLGRVMRDTHVTSAEIAVSESKLELSDWVPFRRVMGRPGVATMIGHVRIPAIDGTTPASYSDAVVNTVLRPRWQGDGLLITDDLTMGAVTRSKEGLGLAAIKALNAGVDIILLSSTEGYFDTVMSALIEADANGEIDRAREAQSRERLSRYVFVDDAESSSAPPAAPEPQPQTQR